MNPTKEFRDYLISQGAALVGIGDLTAVPSSDYPVGIAVAVPLPKHIIKDLQLAPTREYYELYTTLNDKLNAIVTAGEEYLISRGYHAYALTTDRIMVDSDNHSSLPTQDCRHQSRPWLDRQKLSAGNTTIWICRKDFFSSDRCPVNLRCSDHTLSVWCLSCLRPVLPCTCTEKYIVASGYATRRYRICLCML